MASKVVTANRLLDGAVVYMAPEGRWTECLVKAFVGSDEDSGSMMAMAERSVADRLVVTPYPIDVEEGPQGLVPSHIKEVIRATGPTVRLDLGKQAGDVCGEHHVSL
ncbi:MAG: DUF2849 domain-containing protein [Alphaproteobacteria bacterium]|jgi:hypothetical protein|nr:DUF2849 domain-containing protein [Rhodospirillaceae bacterium]MDG2482977.1 DUF2849 domain-containing protein [Alphaproteobacteria bacterium]MBT6204134.1 DUF2849 domain-containing protein [Rhodospirillaceae bacterium]MBT6512642.1 DUF2849 domain-containing protein [Rhodospirillaceae bacterium]MBT7612321.1 DUF2849 domain-containing protein [Rhodospirillaceae bacterium]